jgi:predicted nucleic acid-binding protein
MTSGNCIMQWPYAESVSRAAAGKVCLKHADSMLLTEDRDFARFRKLTLVTNNTQHFARMAGVAVENWLLAS